MRGLLSRILHWRYIVPTAILATVLGLAALAGGVTVAGELEKSNAFCASCHTEPETTYLMRFGDSLNGTALDLASFHFARVKSALSPPAPNIRCIDCHAGEGVVGRSTVLSLAAYDALKYYTGTARQPAKTVFPVQNEACMKCHAQQVTKFADQPQVPFIIDNHFHYKYFQPGAPSVSCVACHVTHRVGSELNQYQFNKVTIPVCEACHQYEGRGPVKMQ